jgi:hypothetical protein
MNTHINKHTHTYIYKYTYTYTHTRSKHHATREPTVRNARCPHKDPRLPFAADCGRQRGAQGVAA